MSCREADVVRRRRCVWVPLGCGLGRRGAVWECGSEVRGCAGGEVLGCVGLGNGSREIWCGGRGERCVLRSGFGGRVAGTGPMEWVTAVSPGAGVLVKGFGDCRRPPRRPPKGRAPPRSRAFQAVDSPPSSGRLDTPRQGSRQSPPPANRGSATPRPKAGTWMPDSRPPVTPACWKGSSAG